LPDDAVQYQPFGPPLTGPDGPLELRVVITART
jgi:hypothetical protein